MPFLIRIKYLVRTQTVLARASLLERHFFWFLVGHSLAIWNIRFLIGSPLFDGSQITKGAMALGTRNARRGGWLRRRCESSENFISHNYVDNYSFRQWGQNKSFFPDWFQRKTLVIVVMSSFASFHCLLSLPSNGNNRKRSLLLWDGMDSWEVVGSVSVTDHARRSCACHGMHAYHILYCTVRVLVLYCSIPVRYQVHTYIRTRSSIQQVIRSEKAQ
jgi:hypothetical protein